MARRAFPLVLLLALACSAVAAEGDYSESDKTKVKVRQLLAVQYSTKYCSRLNGHPTDLGYKVNSYSRRWHRQKRGRRVSKASFWGQAAGIKCNRSDFFQDRRESELRPCFGCDGYTKRWTPDYFGTPGWPYVFSPRNPALYPVWALRFKLVGKVKRPDKPTRRICTRITLFGHAPQC